MMWRLNAWLYAGLLRQEIVERNRHYAGGRTHVKSLGSESVIVYAPETDEDGCATHGNFFDATYKAITEKLDWAKRLSKVHTGGRGLPKLLGKPEHKWKELDSCMSSDALLM